MKKLLLPFLLFLGFTFVSGVLFGQTPTISYPATSNYAVGAAITTPLSPTSTNVAAYTYLATGTAFTGGTLRNPYGMAFDGSGNIAVVNNNTGNALKYNAAGAYSGSVFIKASNLSSIDFGNPTSIGFDGSGLPYAAVDNGYIYQYSTAGAYNTTIVSAPQAIEGMYIDGSSNIFAADLPDKAVYEYTTAGDPPILTIPSSTHLSGPVNVVTDGVGNIYILDQTNKDVLKYNSAGTYLSTPVTGLSTTAYGLYVDKSGNIYVGDSGNTNVKVYPPAGGSAIFTKTGISDPRGVLVDSKGTLYVSNFTANTITKYTPAGGYYLTSGVLPAGLVFDSTTGKISGTPAVASSNTFTVTAYSSGGTPGTSNTFTINCTVPPAFTYATPPAYSANVAIAPLSPTVTAGGPLTSAASSPGLPAGLVISTSGVISGTPSMATASAVYTITGTNAAGQTGTAMVTIVVKPAPPVFSYTTPPAYTVNVAIAPLSPAVSSGGPITSASSSPTLPAGLTISTSGVISGTPSAITASATYTITATNASGGSGTATVTIVVNPPAPVLTYPTGNVYTVTSTVTLTPTYAGGYVPTSCTVAPTLPAGLGIGTNGVISGSPTAVTATTTYTVTATNAGGSAASNMFTITVNPQPAATVSYTGSPYTYTVGTTITTLTPTTTNSPTSFTISPNITTNTGLTFTGSNGQLSGTPTIATTAITYTITPINTSGAGTPTTISVTVNPKKPVITYPTPDSYAVGAAVSLSPTNTGGAAASYTVSPALPAGLGISLTTGVISGNPTTVTATATYTVTATNVTGTGTFPISITIGAAPAISYTATPYSEPVNAAITPITPNNTGSAVTTTPSYSTAIGLTATGLSKPWGMTFDASGNLYVVNYTAGTVVKYTGATGTASSFITGLTNPTGIVYDKTNNVFDVSTVAGYVYKYPATGGATATSTLVTGGSGTTTNPKYIYGIAIDNSSNLYMADPYAGYIYKYSGGTTSVIISYSGNTAYLYDPISVQVDAAGNIYTLDNEIINGSYERPLVKWNSSGASPQTLVAGSTFTTPYGFSLDANGNIYVGDSGNDKVYVFNSSGTPITSFTPTGTDPRGLITDAAGDLFVSDYTANTVTKYPAVYGYVISPTALPAGLSFNNTTGVVSGTPALSTSGSTYTYSVVAYNTFGTSNTTPLVIKCYTSYDWTGATSAFALNTNWESQITPGLGNTISIGVNFPFTVAPSVTANTTIAGMLLGDKGGSASGVNVTTGNTLTVTGDITKQSDATATASYVSGFLGGGTISAANINVISNSVYTAAYTTTISSGINSLILSGNVNLTSGFSTFAENATFNVAGGSVTSVAGLLKTTNAAGSTSTFNVTNSTLQLANSAALSSLSGNGTNVLSFANTGATIEYSGAGQTFYTDATIPGLTGGVTYQNIKFSGTGAKTPYATASNLNVAGDFTNVLANTAAGNVALGGITVNFNGSIVQNLYGGPGPTIAVGALTTTAPSPTGTVFGNVTFINPGSLNNPKNIVSGGFSVASTGVLSMLGTQSYTSLNIAAAGSLTLLSTATSSASVAPLATGGPSITGNVNVQRFVTGGSGYRGYRLMSSPVHVSGAANNAYSFNYVINSSYVKGDVGPANGFDLLGNPNLYLYRNGIMPSNATFTSGNYRGVSKINNSPAYLYSFDGEASNYYTYPGQGFLFFFRGDRNAATITTESVTSPAYVPTNTIITSTGVLNQQAVTTKYWYNPSNSLDYSPVTGNSAVVGFNLVGNPYACTIDLSTYSTGGIAISSNVETKIYEFNTNAPYAQQYAIYNLASPALSTNGATQYVASGEGFFAVADATGQTITFNETAKVTTAASQPVSGANGNLFMASRASGQEMRVKSTDPLKYLRLTLAKDSTSAEDITMSFNESASPNYVSAEDALYHQGTGAVSMSSMSADKKPLGINILPLNKKGITTIPLNVSAINDGPYTLSMTELKNIPQRYEIWLMDAYLKDSSDMRKNALYSFNIAHADTNSFGSNRFTLVLRDDPKKGVRLLNFIANKVVNGAKVIWKIENEMNYTNFTVQRSVDNGKTFDNLNAFVSNDEGSYSFLDTHPVMPADNYRLKITDLNGDISYSDIAPLQYSDLSNNIAKNALTIYPNPTVGPINIAITQTFKTASFGIQVVNSNGTVVNKTTSTTPTWQGDMSKLLPGTYVIQVMNNTDKTVVGKGTFVKL